MTIFEMLQQSAVLTVFGMAIVFVFLWVMIFCVDLMGKLINKTGLDKDMAGPKNEVPDKACITMPSEHVAAISAAVAEYQKEA